MPMDQAIASESDIRLADVPYVEIDVDQLSPALRPAVQTLGTDGRPLSPADVALFVLSIRRAIMERQATREELLAGVMLEEAKVLDLGDRLATAEGPDNHLQAHEVLALRGKLAMAEAGRRRLQRKIRQVELEAMAYYWKLTERHGEL